jgi:hypothetical protein
VAQLGFLYTCNSIGYARAIGTFSVFFDAHRDGKNGGKFTRKPEIEDWNS